MNHIDTMKLAMDALEPFITPNWAGSGVDKANAAYTALRSALSEQLAQQEPVGEWGDGRSDAKRILWKPGYVVAAKVGDKLYAAPQPAHRKPLTPEKVVKLKDAFYAGFESYVTPAAPCSDVDEEWAKYKSAHNIKENT